jgi:hypothetical protein
MTGADSSGELEPRQTRHGARSCRAAAGVRSSAVETARGDAAVGDVAKSTADGALEDEPTNSSRMVVAAGNGGLDGVGDGVNLSVHGRNRGRHLLPWMNSNSGELSASAPVNSFPLCLLAVVGRARA